MSPMRMCDAFLWREFVCMDRILTLMGSSTDEGNEMRRDILVALVLACWIAAGPGARAQSPAGGSAPGQEQSKPAGAAQSGAGSQTGSNSFPEDTSAVPVLPSKVTPALPNGTYIPADGGADSGRVTLPGEDLDPVRSPDDPAPAANSEPDQDSSSSLAGIGKLLPKPDDDQPDRKRKLKVQEPVHEETAASDIDVGKYYLQTRNWRAAQSRFESAMVLDPENPEVYWGLAEAERRLGKFAEARAHYLRLLDYDPDGPHGKDARKALKGPEIENAKSTTGGQPAAASAK